MDNLFLHLYPVVIVFGRHYFLPIISQLFVLWLQDPVLVRSTILSPCCMHHWLLVKIRDLQCTKVRTKVLKGVVEAVINPWERKHMIYF